MYVDRSMVHLAVVPLLLSSTRPTSDSSSVFVFRLLRHQPPRIGAHALKDLKHSITTYYVAT